MIDTLLTAPGVIESLLAQLSAEGVDLLNQWAKMRIEHRAHQRAMIGVSR